MSVDTPTCVSLPSVPAPLQVRLPGGIVLQGVPSIQTGIVTPMLNVQAMLGALGPALSGLAPIFTLIDTVVAVGDTLKAIPGLIVGDVESFTDALGRVVEGIGKLVQMAPQVAVPVLVMDVVAVITQGLQAQRELLVRVLELQQQAQDVLDQAAALVPPNAVVQANLEAAAACMEAQAALMTAHSEAAMGPLVQLQGMITNLMNMVPGLPALPDLSELTGDSAEQLIETLDTVIQVLQAFQIPGV